MGCMERSGSSHLLLFANFKVHTVASYSTISISCVQYVLYITIIVESTHTQCTYSSACYDIVHTYFTENTLYTHYMYVSTYSTAYVSPVFIH